MSRHSIALLCLILTGTLAAGGQQRSGPTFFDDDPLWIEPVTQNVTEASDYEPNLVYQTAHGLLSKPPDPSADVRAKNINTVDGVPDSPFYVNRAGRQILTPPLVARAANTSDGPAPSPWTVVSAKSDGVTPGFTIRDSKNDLWFIKFDPPGYRAMATGTEVVAAKLFWAVGYHTVEYYLRQLSPSDLVIGAKAQVTPAGGKSRPMVQADVEMLLEKADRDPDGTYRIIVSKAAPGRPVGRIRFEGTRKDDPNDIVPHEHRRELRAYRTFAAWLNHVDAKGINSLEALVTEQGRSFIRRYLLDFGSVLGSAAVGPREKWEGYEGLVERPGEFVGRTLTLGLKVPSWRTLDWYEHPAIGRVQQSHASWDPQRWAPHIMNGAFWHLRADDAFWAAEKLSFITDDIIEAAVAEGRFGAPVAERELARTIRERRDRILQTYLPALNPVTDLRLDGNRLQFRNAAVDAGMAPAPSKYVAEWFTFNNETGERRPLGTTEATTVSLPQVTGLPSTGFVAVEVKSEGGPAAWRRPVTAHFRRTATEWRLVGFVRQP